MSKTDETSPAFNLNDRTRLAAPLKWIWAAGTLVALVAIAWANLRSQVTDHGARIQKLELDTHAAREVLIRIDERTAEIKRRLEAR